MERKSSYAARKKRRKADSKTAAVQPATHPLIDSKLFRVLVYLLLIFLVIFVGSKVSFIFNPAVVLVSTLFLPVFLAGILYYLFAPLVNLIQRGPIPRSAAIIMVYLVLGSLLGLAVLLMIPVLRSQLESLIRNTPLFVKQARVIFEDLLENGRLVKWIPEAESLIELIPERLSGMTQSLYQGISSNFSNFVSFIADLVIVLTTVPFILFFMLKDGARLPVFLARFFPDDFKDEAESIIISMGKTLGMYIKGQMLVSTFVGIMLLTGYLVLGLDYALLLALIALLTNLIPYVGPIIGTVPGMVLALMNSPAKMLQVLVLVVIVQQVESQLISPLVMGKQLKIHPLLIIFLLLTAGSLAGFLGLILAVPVFAVSRTAFVHLYRLYKLRKKALGKKVLN